MRCRSHASFFIAMCFSFSLSLSEIFQVRMDEENEGGGEGLVEDEEGRKINHCCMSEGIHTDIAMKET